jgi:hypothetical protein
MTREISSLKSKFKDMESGSAASNGSAETDEPQDNAGDQFGGRASKKSKK